MEASSRTPDSENATHIYVWHGTDQRWRLRNVVPGSGPRWAPSEHHTKDHNMESCRVPLCMQGTGVLASGGRVGVGVRGAEAGLPDWP